MRKILFTSLLVALFCYASIARASNECRNILETNKPIDLSEDQSLFQDLIFSIEKHHQYSSALEKRGKLFESMDKMGLADSIMRKSLPIYEISSKETLELSQRFISLEKYSEYREQTLDAYKKIIKDVNLSEPLSLIALIESLYNMQALNSRIDPEEYKENQEELADKENELEKKQNQEPQEQEGSQQQGNSSQSQPDNSQKKKESEEEQDKGLVEEELREYRDEIEDFDFEPNTGKINYIMGFQIDALKNPEAPFVAFSFMEEIHSDRMSENLSLRPVEKPAQLSRGEKHTNLAFFKPSKSVNEISMGAPEGWQIITGRYGDITVEQTPSGGYSAKTSKGKFDGPFSTYIQRKSSATLSKKQIEGLSTKSGISADKWPGHLKDTLDILSDSEKNPTKKVATLAEYFKNTKNFTYASKNDLTEAEMQNAKSQVEQLRSSMPASLAYAKVGIMQCDGASRLFATVVRDFFGLPTRVVLGRTIKGIRAFSEDPTPYHVVSADDPRHAWVQVYIQGEWVSFEVTPKLRNENKEKNDDGDGGKESNGDPNLEPLENNSEDKKSDLSEDQDSQSKGEAKENESSEKEGKPEPSESSDSQEVSESQNSSEGEGESGSSSNQQVKMSELKRNSGTGERKEKQESNPDEATAETGEKLEEQNASESSKANEEKQGEDPRNSESGNDTTNQNTKTEAEASTSDKLDPKNNREENKASEFGDKGFYVNQKLPRNFFGIFWSQYTADTLRSYLSTRSRSETMISFERLSEVRTNSSDESGALVSLAYKVNSVVNNLFYAPDKSLREVFLEYRSKGSSKQTELISTIHSSAAILEMIKEFDRLTDEESELLAALYKVASEAKKNRHKDSVQAEAVERMFRDLPGNVTKDMLLQKYPEALSMGSSDQNLMMNHLLEGSLAGFHQASLISKYFRFVLLGNATLSYDSEVNLMRHWQKDGDNEGPVLAEFSDITRFSRFIVDPTPSLDPVEMMLGKLVKKEQYLSFYQQSEVVPGSTKVVEKKRSRLYYDISGSMTGSNARVQASSILAYVDKALSEVDAYGNPVHEVLIYPFGDVVHTDGIIVIKTREQAVQLLEQFAMYETPSIEGTTITGPYMHFLESIERDYLSKADHKFDRENMVLFTDGIDEGVDYDGIKRKVAALPKEVKFLFHLVSFDNHNKDLSDLSQATKGENTMELHHFFSSEKIGEFITESNSYPLDENAYRVDESNKHWLDPALLRSLNFHVVTPKAEHYHDMRSRIAIDTSSKASDTSAENLLFLKRLDEWIPQGLIPSEIRARVAERLLRDYAYLQGRPLNRVTELEKRLLQNLDDWVVKGR